MFIFWFRIKIQKYTKAKLCQHKRQKQARIYLKTNQRTKLNLRVPNILIVKCVFKAQSAQCSCFLGFVAEQTLTRTHTHTQTTGLCGGEITKNAICCNKGVEEHRREMAHYQ